MILFIVTEKLPIMTSSRSRDRDFRIANEGDSEQGASRQHLKSIEICFNSSHRRKIEMYLDRIH